MRNRASLLQGDVDVPMRRAAMLGIGLFVASCAAESPKTSTSSSVGLVTAGLASSDKSAHRNATGIGCPDPSSYFIEVTGDAGTTTLRSSCANATGDFGAVGAVGGPFTSYTRATTPEVLLEACSDRSRNAAKISIVFGNQSSGGSIYFKDATGTVFLAYNLGNSSSDLRIGPLGGTIEGTYGAELRRAGPDGLGQVQGPTISGSFRVCHLQDVDLTPVK